MTDQEETHEHSDPEQESEQGSKPKQKRVKARRASIQLQATLDAYDDILASTTLKEGKRADLLIEKTHTLLQLCQLKQAEDADESLKENAVLKAQREQDSARITELEAEVTSLKASQHPVEVRTVPDPETPQLRADLKLKDEMLAAVVEAVKSSLSHPQRINFAAVVVARCGRACQSFLSQVTDFSLIWWASQKRDDELQEVISLAQPNARGDGVLVSRAVLAARNVPVVGPQAKPVYKDVFTELDGAPF
ncbi:MAG: hypothetical protein WB249_07005 [Candidatus Sulfotelmatobacter sp.]